MPRLPSPGRPSLTPPGGRLPRQLISLLAGHRHGRQEGLPAGRGGMQGLRPPAGRLGALIARRHREEVRSPGGLPLPLRPGGEGVRQPPSPQQRASSRAPERGASMAHAGRLGPLPDPADPPARGGGGGHPHPRRQPMERRFLDHRPCRINGDRRHSSRHPGAVRQGGSRRGVRPPIGRRAVQPLGRHPHGDPGRTAPAELEHERRMGGQPWQQPPG